MKKSYIIRHGFIILIIIAYLLPLGFALFSLFSGRFAFWFDPARDFLLAQESLRKPTLIGPPSGIPGVFYGPYWIWLLSIGLFVSADPRIVVFLTLTVLYFLIFPYILYRFRFIFGWVTSVLLWLLFAITYGIKYAINPWNPYVAPVLCLVLIYTLVTLKNSTKNKLIVVEYVIVGLLAGLIVNVHISFGIGIGFGTLIYFVLQAIVDREKKSYLIRRCISYLLGIFIVFLPFFVFEIRHGFHQIQTTLHVLTASASVVTVTGLSKIEIASGMLWAFTDYFILPKNVSVVMLLILLVVFAYNWYVRKHIEEREKRIVMIVGSLLFGILFVYLSSKNPVWTYHFIGVEILFLVLFGLIIKKNRIAQIGVFLVIIFSYAQTMITTYQSFSQTRFSTPMLVTQEYIVRLINTDAGSKDYTVFVYNPAIYTYEYTYLFSWLASKDIPYDPGLLPQNKALVYIVIPQKTPSADAFINAKTNGKVYKTAQTWETIDGATVIKRVKR